MKEILPQKWMIGYILKKIVQQLPLMFYIKKKCKHVQLIFQNVTQPMKNTESF